MHDFLRFLRGPQFGPQMRRTFMLALPLMLGELSGILMGVFGTMMVGQLGDTALAATSVAGVIFVVSMLLIWGGFRVVPTPVAESHELRDGLRTRTLVISAFMMAAVFLLFCLAMLWIGILNFDLLQQDPAVGILAVEYLKMIAYSMPAIILFTVLVNLMDAFEYVRLTLVVSLAGLAVDLSLNWLLIFGHWGFPKMGMVAVAFNTGISHAVMAAVLLIVLLRQKELAYFRTAATDWAAIRLQTLSFIRYGLPSALQMFIEFAAFGIGSILVGQIGKTEQAAHQIAMNLISVTYVTILGISTAGMIRVGQALAYKSRVRVWMAGIACLMLGVLVMLIPTAAFFLFPKQIAGLYIEDPAVIGLAGGLLLLAALFQLADAAQATSMSMLRSLNDVVQPSVISLLAFWVIGVPIGYYLAFHAGWNARGIWVGYLIALIIQAILFMRRFFSLIKRI